MPQANAPSFYCISDKKAHRQEVATLLLPYGTLTRSLLPRMGMSSPLGVPAGAIWIFL